MFLSTLAKDNVSVQYVDNEQKERVGLLQGALDLLILRTLILGPTHGAAISKSIEFNSDDVLQVEQRSLYPALHRLIKRGWITAEEGISENHRRAKFYRLTSNGRRQPAVKTSKWKNWRERSHAFFDLLTKKASHEST